MSAVIVHTLCTVSKRCNRCNKFRLPNQIAFGNEAMGFTCINCYHQHQVMLDEFLVRKKGSCNECGLTFEQMHERRMVEELKIFEKDGWIALLCSACWDKYALKTHQIKGTAYERIAKIR